MLRKIKTHISYKKDGIEIRPASLHEEYEVGRWYSVYDAEMLRILMSGFQTHQN